MDPGYITRGRACWLAARDWMASTPVPGGASAPYTLARQCACSGVYFSMLHAPTASLLVSAAACQGVVQRTATLHRQVHHSSLTASSWCRCSGHCQDRCNQKQQPRCSPVAAVGVLHRVHGHALEAAPADGEGERVAVLEHARKPAVALQAQLHEAPALLRRRQAAHQQRLRWVPVL